MTPQDRFTLNLCRARSIALFESIPNDEPFIPESFAADFESIRLEVGTLLKMNLSSLAVENLPQYGDEYDDVELKSRVRQLIAVLNAVFSEDAPDKQSVISSARDDDLRGRCQDLLDKAEGRFDRAINQATLVLEDKVRRYSDLPGEVGISLFSKAISSDPTHSIIKLSGNKEIQTGYSEICRGLTRVFRNPTHHHALDVYTRLEAEAVCIFIDHLLDVIKKSIAR